MWTKWNRPAGWRTSTEGDGTAAEYSAGASFFKCTGWISHALLNKRWSEIGDWVLDNLKIFKELIDLNNELKDETDE